MARLIDADAYIAQYCKDCGFGCDLPGECCITVDDLMKAKTVDAVPVVRCKDCWKSAEGLCSYQFKDVPGKDFCGDGERKEK